MPRADKLYQRLDMFAEDYRQRVIAELKLAEEGESSYPFSPFLDRIRRKDPSERMPVFIHARHLAPSYDRANELIELERQILHLCEKLNERLPAPFAILKEYGEEFRQLEVGLEPWKLDPTRSYHRGHKRLLREALHKLAECEKKE